MLVLEAPPTALARRYLRDDRESELHPVLPRWRRAHALGVKHESEAYPEGSSGSELAHRRDRLIDVFREERTVLAPLAQQLAARGLLAIVADPDGVILEVHGGGEFIERAARVRLVEGACWREETRGTNAIGTALAERRAVAVVGAAHYEERNRGLFCYATPVHDAYGEIVAVLDVTGSMRAHDPSVAVAVEAAGSALERALRGLAFAEHTGQNRGALERLVHHSKEPCFLVEASGAVRVLNDAARGELLQGLQVPRELDAPRILGLGFGELLALARAGSRDLRFEGPRGTSRVELDPIFGAGGRALAVIVHLEPQRISAPPPKPAPPVVDRAFAPILGDDTALVAARAHAARLAGTELPILLLAETGTGKELFARAIHAASPRRDKPFVAINCGALSPQLLESELFGYAPGAFTGAARGGSDGKLGSADRGTLFLDEIAEMPEALQAALLRVLDDGAYYRVGDPKQRRVDFRLVGATCRDLLSLVEAGKFRRDLFFRIHGACVGIPPLRARADRTSLARELLALLDPSKHLGESALAWIAAHDWPGNVRELKSALVHAAALADGRTLEERHFPRPMLRPTATTPPVALAADVRTRDEVLAEAIRAAVAASGGNVSAAARKLGVARSTIYRALGRDEK